MEELYLKLAGLRRFKRLRPQRGHLLGLTLKAPHAQACSIEAVE
jgi:hypothetical protein